MKRSQLKRRAPLRVKSRLETRPAGLAKHGRSKAGNPIPLSMRRQVAARSGGVCELGCGARAVHVHHRKLRSQGGRHELGNLLHVCHAHHESAHANPARSYALGWLVPGWCDPSAVPVTPGPVLVS